MTKEEAQRVLDRYHPLFVEAIQAAWGNWLKVKEDNPMVGPRARASLVFDFITEEMRRRLVDYPGIRMVHVRGIEMFLIGDAVVVRMKKANARGRTRYTPTQQALAFMRQLPLPGVPVVARINVGWALGEAGDLQPPVVSLQVGSSVVWTYRIDEATPLTILPVVESEPLESGPRFKLAGQEDAKEIES